MEKIQCNNCGEIYDTEFFQEPPTDLHGNKATGLKCNWCPMCEDSADEYYHEWYVYEHIEYHEDLKNPNQLNLFA